jgi:hypothetical protein
MRTCREPISMTKKQYGRWSVIAQSTWKKSQASTVDACVRRNCRHVISVCRRGAGGIFSCRRTRRMVGRADPVADLEQLALDPLVPPGGVLGSEPPDEHGDPGPDRLPPCPVRVSPPPGDQAAMPPQDGAGRDQPVRPQGPGQVPDQRGEHRAVGPVHAGPWLGPPQHRDLMAQDEQPGVLGCWGSAQKDEPCGDPGEDQVQQAHRHG